MNSGRHGSGQYAFSTEPIVRRENVRTSCRRSSASENIRCVGAYCPDPNKLSRKVAPSGFDVVVPGIRDDMTEFAGTTQVSLRREIPCTCELTGKA